MNLELIIRLSGISLVSGAVFFLTLSLKNRFQQYRNGGALRELPHSLKETPLSKQEVHGRQAKRMNADPPAHFIHFSILAGLVLGLLGHAFSIPGRLASSPRRSGIATPGYVPPAATPGIADAYVLRLPGPRLPVGGGR